MRATWGVVGGIWGLLGDLRRIPLGILGNYLDTSLIQLWDNLETSWGFLWNYIGLLGNYLGSSWSLLWDYVVTWVLLINFMVFFRTTWQLLGDYGGYFGITWGL